MIKGVVCLSILDAYHYLIDSYRPYQLRNNNLAAAFDGVHGRAVQVKMGMAVLQNATATSPTALAVARGAKRSGTKTSEPAGGRRADRRIREALPPQWEISPRRHHDRAGEGHGDSSRGQHGQGQALSHASSAEEEGTVAAAVVELWISPRNSAVTFCCVSLMSRRT